MIENWIKEIVDEFKSMSLEERIAHLNDESEHELIRAISEIESQLEKNSFLELMFSFSPFMDTVASSPNFEFGAFILEALAANDERFALAA